MTNIPDVHRQFSDFFEDKTLSPFLYLLSKRFSEGHICLDLADLDSEELKEGGFKNLDLSNLKNVEMVGDERDYQPFILWKNKLYLQRYFYYETTVYQRIIELIKNEKETQQNTEKQLLSLKNDIATLFPPDELRIRGFIAKYRLA